jgi:DNA adenine methylase
MLARSLIRLFPEHDKYIEVFGGGASLLFAKEPVGLEVYNDLDQDLTNFFRVLRNPDQFQRFVQLASLTPYSRSEYYRALRTWQSCDDPVGRAFNWYIVARWSFSGRFGAGHATSTNTVARGMAGAVSRWLSIVEKLPEAHARLSRVQIECQDWRTILERYDGPGSFVYVDPPYVPDTRRQGTYAHELTEADHAELVDRLLAYPGKVMLSGYAHSVHEPLVREGWNKTDIATVCVAAGGVRNSGLRGPGALTKHQPRIESAWRNYTTGDEDAT